MKIEISHCNYWQNSSATDKDIGMEDTMLLTSVQEILTIKCCQPTQIDLRNEWELKTEKKIINRDVITEDLSQENELSSENGTSGNASRGRKEQQEEKKV